MSSTTAPATFHAHKPNPHRVRALGLLLALVDEHDRINGITDDENREEELMPDDEAPKPDAPEKPEERREETATPPPTTTTQAEPPPRWTPPPSRIPDRAAIRTRGRR